MIQNGEIDGTQTLLGDRCKQMDPMIVVTIMEGWVWFQNCVGYARILSLNIPCCHWGMHHKAGKQWMMVQVDFM